ncbi:MULTISPECIES: hypothetical protein [Pseudomonas]|nr:MULTISPECIES: hypothetical protein [Pseudomonas]MBA6113519.1 hypothetical protein [Pseudomonas asiatica]
MEDPTLLARFRDEVLLSGQEASLPRNLSDFWLEEIQNQLERYFESLERSPDEEDEGVDMALPLAAIVHILFAKNGGEEISETLEKLYEYFQDYRLELALEEISRKTDVISEPATLESIFTNREVLVERSKLLQ